ncbi:hypothetical protein ABIE78_000941 [Sinorhizobium fredii]
MGKRIEKSRLYASALGTRKSFPTQIGQVGNGWGNTVWRTITGPVSHPFPHHPYTPCKGVRVGKRWWGGPVSEWVRQPPTCSGGVEVGGD